MATQVDIFISHAGEDKDLIARPLAEALRQNSFRVWYDEYTLKLGDRLRSSIDEGLNRCQYGIVILSHAFFSKEWPQRELDGMFAREIDEGRTLIMPVWHGVVVADIRRYSAILADRVAISTTKGIPAIIAAVRQLFEAQITEAAVRQEIAQIPAPLLFPPKIKDQDPLRKCLPSIVTSATEVARTVMIRRLERLSLPEQSEVINALTSCGIISDESGNLLPALLNSLRGESGLERDAGDSPPHLFERLFASSELDRSRFARSIQADAITSIADTVRTTRSDTEQLVRTLRDSCDVTAYSMLGWALDAAATAVKAEKGRSPARDRHLEVFWEEALSQLKVFWQKAEAEL